VISTVDLSFATVNRSRLEQGGNATFSRAVRQKRFVRNSRLLKALPDVALPDIVGNAA